MRVSAGAFAVVMVCAGVLFSTTATTSAGTSLRSEQTDLTGIVRDRQRDVTQLSEQVARERTRHDALAAKASPTTPDDRGVQTQKMWGELRGPGVEVRLDDAPASVAVPDGLSAGDLVVHQQDVDAVVNALWAGGAKGVSVAGVRLGPTSTVRCAGNTLRVGGQVFAPPCTIAAVGNLDTLQRALERDAAVQVYRQYADTVGLGYGIRPRETLTLGPYEPPPRVSYARLGETHE